jgi:flagellar assembly protein FliH
MSDFKLHNFTVDSEEVDQSEFKVVNIDNDNKPIIKNFVLDALKEKGQGNYSEVKAKYGAIAVTDSERDDRRQKDRRFSINPLLRDPLSIEEEERRIIGEKVRAKVEALADEAKAEASAVGYEEGLKQGYEDAYKKVAADGAVDLERFQSFVKEAENLKSEIFRANERFLVELMFRIARMILLKDLSVDREYLLRLAKELISRVGARDNITLKISSEEAKTIELLKEGLRKNFGTMNNLNIEVSTQVQRGGCQLETEWNAIDARVETQLEGIYRGLVGKDSEGDV